VKHLLLPLFLFAGLVSHSQKMLLFKEAPIHHPSPDFAIDAWNKNQPGFSSLTASEREFLYWVNYSRANLRRFFDSVVVPIVDLYPQLKGDNFESLRKDLENSPAVKLLALNVDLEKMAKEHALDIVRNGSKPSHNSTNGDSFSDRFKQKGLKNCGAENLSFGAGDPAFLLVLLYLDINVPDLGHRKTLLNPNYTDTGIGAATYKDGSIFIVEDFSCPQH
jgi:hypothetical protein